MPDPNQLHKAFRRVRLETMGKLANEEVAQHVAAQRRILCIVNTRQRASDLFQLIRELPDAFHLSARMCPAHRTNTLAKIRRQLENGRNCRVVATQLVEAGVDLDFPVVYREMAGLDAIAQAAGRCNRNANLDYGEVKVFLPEDGGIPRIFRRAAGAADSVLRRFKDPFSPEALTDYFRQIYTIADQELDAKQILANLEDGARAADLPFRDVAQKFRLIESDMLPVIVPWEKKAEKLIAKLAYAEFPGSVLRQLQSYTVQVYPQDYARLASSGAIRLIQERYLALVSLVPFYRPDCGLSVESASLPPEDFLL
jgi:CRISPR-associated endonuclease/helicase Cas3